MFLQGPLELIISLAFIYSLLSLACMQVQEWLAGWLRWRAENLEDGLREMIADDALSASWSRTLRKIPILKQVLKAIGRWPVIKNIIKPESVPGWVEALYAHPLIRSLAQPGKKPSYIPAQNFALVLFDMVVTAGTEASIIQHSLYALRVQIRNLSKVSEKDRLACEQILKKAIEQTNQLIDLSRPDKINSSIYDELRKKTWSALREQLTVLGVSTTDNWKRPPNVLALRDNTVLTPLLHKNPELRKAAIELLTQMYRTIDEVHEIPFPESFPSSPPTGPFDHISAELTERSIRQGITALYVLKPALARALDSILLDASTFATKQEQALAVARTNIEKWFDATMDRTSGWYKRNVQLTLFIIGLFVASLLNIDSITIANTLWREPTIRQALVAQAENYQQPQPGSDNDPAQAIRKLSTTLSQDLSLPVGWTPETKPAKTEDWLSKILGILATAMAISFGAPFWFDILDKFMNIRGAGQKPAKVEDQQPSDLNGSSG